MLGLYSVLERVTTAFPDVLFEGCSSGGGRFDAGMLHYMPQTWSSDDSDAVERLYIQEGLGLVYPFCTMGAHISAIPNHQIGRNTPIKLRGQVAMPGQFGFELDLSKMSDEDKAASKELIKTYKQYGEVFHKGDYYKLASIFKGQNSAWEFVSEDKNTVIVMTYNIQGKVAVPSKVLKLKGLCPDAKYEEVATGKVYGGDTLMNLGIFQNCDHDMASEMRVFKKI
jgi:alpha-galactosidase